MKKFVVVLALIFLASHARADTMHYVISEVLYYSPDPQPVVAFDIDTHPTPTESGHDSYGDYFLALAQNVTIFGLPAHDETVQFSDNQQINIGDCRFAYGAVCDLGYELNSYYSGSVEAPTLLAGTYEYSDPTGLHGTIVATDIPDAPAPTPEPSGIALLGTGFVGMAFATRHRLRNVWR